ATDEPIKKKEFNPTISCEDMDEEEYEDYEGSIQNCFNINQHKLRIMQSYLIGRGRFKDELFTFEFCVNKNGYIEAIETKKSSDLPNLEIYVRMYFLKLRFPKPIKRKCFTKSFDFREKRPEKVEVNSSD
ncbi:MAG: hypothetical protein V7785_23090, partial [Bermanella sp.]